jgi:hypothetical protein
MLCATWHTPVDPRLAANRVGEAASTRECVLLKVLKEQP